MDQFIKASCSCGSVTFGSTTEPVVQFICHCTDCRAATGLPQTRTAIFNTRSTERYGLLTRHRFTASSGATTYRDACKLCGDVIFDISDQYPQLIGVLADRFLPPFEFTPAHHIWLQSRDSKAPIDDGLKLHRRGLFEG